MTLVPIVQCPTAEVRIDQGRNRTRGELSKVEFHIVLAKEKIQDLLISFIEINVSDERFTVKPVFSDHINQDMFLAF